MQKHTVTDENSQKQELYSKIEHLEADNAALRRRIHESSESGTHEYGIYSSPDLATARAKDIWKQCDYPEGYEETTGGLYLSTGWDSFSVSISEYVTDVPIDKDMCGYT